MKNQNFFILSNNIFHYNLSPSEFTVFSYLSRCANRERGNTCFPSWSNIAEHCNISRRTVGRALKSLEGKELIASKNQFHDNRQVSNLYVVETLLETHAPVSFFPAHGVKLADRTILKEQD